MRERTMVRNEAEIRVANSDGIQEKGNKGLKGGAKRRDGGEAAQKPMRSISGNERGVATESLIRSEAGRKAE